MKYCLSHEVRPRSFFHVGFHASNVFQLFTELIGGVTQVFVSLSLIKGFKMRLVILDDYDRVSEWAAKYVRNKILEAKPSPGKYFVLGLPTGMFQ